MSNTLHESIKALGEESYSGEFQTDIYLDPEEKKVYSHINTNSIPVSAHNKIDIRILTVRPHVIPDTITDALEEIIPKLELLIDSYLGSEWNGSNFIGQWDDETLEQFDFALNESPLEVGYYWEPYEWFEPVLGELKQSWEQGKNAEQIISAQDLGCNDSDGCCDKNAAIEWLEDQISEWETEEDD